MIFGSLGLLLMSFAPGAGAWSSLGSLDATQWAALAFLVLACSVGGYWAWNFALSRLEARRAGVWIYLEPVIAMSLGLTILDERYGVAAFAGAAAIALSVALATWKSC
jgi:drug/metabolite transporter (DMT)-like permease